MKQKLHGQFVKTVAVASPVSRNGRKIVPTEVLVYGGIGDK